MCTWCPTGVVCDLLIRECVSELGMYPCLSLCPDDGGAWYVFGFRAGRPSSCAYYYYCRYYSYYFRWVATVGSTGYGRSHRRVRIGARCGGPGHVTYIVPYSALSLDPSMCVLTPREFPPPLPAAILR